VTGPLSKRHFRQQRLHEIEAEARQLDRAYAGRELPPTAADRIAALEAEHRDVAAEIAALIEAGE
jgi:hypothetical protein